jgi:hypothetical protein
MFTVFFNGTWECEIATFQERQKVNSAPFTESVLRALAEICYPQGRGTRKRIFMLHFDNAPFTTLRGSERIWRVLDSEEWRIRLITRIQHHVTSFFSVQ